ncbi:putative 3-phenylpropionic acid transporter [Rhodocyclaceae bacterium]|nr:putative 3-phenylpropionic acid transporter [Rhodocyclaceae bacterium]
MYSHWRLSAWYFFYFAYIGAFAPYFTLYLQSLSFSAWDIGVLMSVGQVMRLLAPTLWGWLADRLGRRIPIVRLSAILSVAGFFAFFVTVEFWGVFVGMCAMTFFWSASLPLVEALTLDHLKGRTEDYGRIRLWGSVGFVAAVLGVGALLDAAPLTTLLWVCAILLAGIVACAAVLEEAPPAATARTHPPLRLALLRPEVLALLAACFFMSAAHGPLYVFLSIHLVDHGYGKTLVGALWSLGVVAEILVFLLMPRLIRRHSPRAILLASFALAVLRFLLIGWQVDSLPLLLAAQAMHGATFGAFHVAAVTALNRWFPSQQQGRVQALYGSISFGAGGMLGNLFSGEAWTTLGPEWTYTVGSFFAFVGWLLVWRGMATTGGGTGR